MRCTFGSVSSTSGTTRREKIKIVWRIVSAEHKRSYSEKCFKCFGQWTVAFKTTQRPVDFYCMNEKKKFVFHRRKKRKEVWNASPTVTVLFSYVGLYFLPFNFLQDSMLYSTIWHHITVEETSSWLPDHKSLTG